MRPRDTLKFLTMVLPQRRAIMLMGPPGIGKSQVFKQAADQMGGGFIDLRAATLDAVDLRGIPNFTKDGRVKWCLPTFFPTKGKGILFLDELPQAPTEVQNGLLELVLDRRLGDYTMPDEWFVGAAGNRAGDRAGANKMTTALSSRFIHVEMEVSLEDWMAWAASHGVHAITQGYIGFSPSSLHKFDPRADTKNFPCPRSWEMVSDVMHTGLHQQCSKEMQFEVFSGCVGKTEAQQYMSWLSVFSKIPSPESVIEDPQGAPLFTELSVAWAMGCALCERIPKLNPKQATNVADYFLRCKKELATFGLLCAWHHHERTLMKHGPVNKWIVDHAKMILGKN